MENGTHIIQLTRLLVASDDESIAADVKALVLHDSRECAEVYVYPLSECVARAAQFRPEVVVVVFPTDPERVFAVMAELKETLPTRIIVVGPAAEAKLILRAYHEGAYQYIDRDELDRALVAVLRRLRSETPMTVRSGRVISAVGASGGCGVSTLAANVATSLARVHRQCALLDMDLECGDLATLLGLQPAHGLADFCKNLSRMDQSLFEMCFEEHPTGIRLLASPWTHTAVQHVTPAGVRKAINMMRNSFPYVVVDLPHGYRPEHAEALFQSDVILLVLRLDFTALRRARRLLDYLTELRIDTSRVRLVVNRFRRPKELRVSDVEQSLGLKVSHFIPEDPARVNRANNKGNPVVLEKPRTEISQSLIEIARSVNGKMR